MKSFMLCSQMIQVLHYAALLNKFYQRNNTYTSISIHRNYFVSLTNILSFKCVHIYMYTYIYIYIGPVYLDCRDGHGFHCDNGTRCLHYSSVCNGVQSCTDGSDERDCCKFICGNTFAIIMYYSASCYCIIRDTVNYWIQLCVDFIF